MLCAQPVVGGCWLLAEDVLHNRAVWLGRGSGAAYWFDVCVRAITQLCQLVCWLWVTFEGLAWLFAFPEVQNTLSSGAAPQLK